MVTFWLCLLAIAGITLLLTRSRFFQHYFPEVDQVEAYHKYGYNLKSQIIRIIVYPFICALIAWICTVIW